MHTMPPSQTIASQASLLPVMSSHFSVPVNTRIITPIKATTPVCMPCILPVAQRTSIRMNTPNIIFSPIDHLPRLASCSLASSWAAFVSWSSGFKTFNRNHGNKSKLTNPGTMLPFTQVIHPNSIPWPELIAASATKPLAAIPVRNIAAVTRFKCEPLSMRYSPARLGWFSGVDPSALANELTIGAITPPPRAVLEGMAGPKMNSAIAVAYPNPKVVLPNLDTQLRAIRCPSPLRIMAPAIRNAPTTSQTVVLP